MEITEVIRAAFKELIVPELDKIKQDVGETKATLLLTNKRLDDLNLHLADQSRRIDEIRTDLTQRIDETNKRIDETRTDLIRRIDETNKRIDETRTDLIRRIDETNKRIEETNKRIDATNGRIDTVLLDIGRRFDEVDKRFEAINTRMDRLYDVVVKRDEHFKLDNRVAALERDVNELMRRIAA